MNRDLAIIAKGGIISLAGIILFRIVGLASKIILGRLGPQDYGAFSIALALFSTIIVICVFGTDASISRLSAGAPKKETAKYFATVARISIPISLVLAAAFWAFSDRIAEIFSSPFLAVVIRWFALAIPLTTFAKLIAGVLAARRAVTGYVLITSVAESVVRLIFLIAFFALGWGLLGGTIAYVAGFAAMFVAAILCIKAYNLPLSFTGKTDKSLISYTIPLFGATILTMLLFTTDTILLGLLQGTESTGIYNAAVPLSKQLLVGAVILMPFFIPTLAARARRKQPLTKIYRQITKWVLMLILPLTLFLVFFPSQIITLLFGTEYASAAAVLRLLAISNFLFAITLPSGGLIRTDKKRMPWAFLAIAITLALNIGLNLLLIPRFGTLGAAIASLISLTAMSATLVLWALTITGALPLARTHLRVAAASFLALLASGIMFSLARSTLGSWTILIAFATLGIAYFPALLLCKALDKQDKAIITGFAARLRLPIPQSWLE